MRTWLGAGSVVFTVAAALAACGDDHAGGARPASADAGADADAGVALCVDGKPVDWPPAPHAIELTSVLPQDLVFEGTDGPVRIREYFEPCAERSRLLVLRSSAAWCGTCGWHVEHTKRVFEDGRLAGRTILVDLLVADEDNMPATPAAALRWRARIDAPGRVAIDPKYTFQPVPLPNSPLPLYVVVDTRTMTVTTVLNDPDPETLQARLALELALLDGQPRPDLPAPTLHDDLLRENQWDMVRAMKLVPAPPPDPTNEFGDSPAAIALGKALFSDALLSPSGTVSCATCHKSEAGLSDGLAQSMGVAKVNRNSPSVALAAHARWQFWDGRADTLWMQALGPFEDDKEFGGSRLFVAKQIAARYATEYAAAFGPKYTLPDMASLPANGKPGDPAWDALPNDVRDAVTRVFVNAGKAIAAFERSLRVKPNALDRYADGDTTALTPEQKTGLLTFFKVGCAQCHFGPRLTNDAFHAIRFPTGRQDGAADRGRIDVLSKLAAAEFVATSPWSDAPSAAKLLSLPEAPSMLGAFKTPTLRGLSATGPYGHGGTLPTLLEVARHYGQRGLEASDPKATGVTEDWLGEFDHGAQRELVPFLEVLTADVEGL